MPDFSYWPFDVTGDTSETGAEVAYIFDALGITSWEEVALDNADSDPRYERAVRYYSPEEALRDMFDRGISAFTRIRYLPNEGFYTIDIIYDE